MNLLKKIYKIIVVVFTVLAILQIKTTNIKQTYLYTPAQIDRQITRMRYYPIKLTRLGYWLEGKKETQIIYVVQKNFVETIDLGTYFPDYFSFVFLPLMMMGLYRIFQKNNRLIIKILLFSIILSTLTGVNGLYGPLTMRVLFLIFIIFGAREIAMYKKK